MAGKVGKETGKNVFISWSGSRSEAVASALYEWIPNVIQLVKPWMSKPDIEKGARWALDLAEELEKTSVGIICLTPENLRAPWILFEAGAMSKAIKESRACTYLFDLKYTDVEGPLAQFNHTKAEKEDTKKLLHTINVALGTPEGPMIKDSQLETSFEKFWPDLEEALKKIPSQQEEAHIKRDQEEKIDDILRVVRRLEKEGVSSRPTMTSPGLWSGVMGSYGSGLGIDPMTGKAVVGINPVTGERLGAVQLGDLLTNRLITQPTVTEPLKPEGDEKEKDKEDEDE